MIRIKFLYKRSTKIKWVYSLSMNQVTMLLLGKNLDRDLTFSHKKLFRSKYIFRLWPRKFIHRKPKIKRWSFTNLKGKMVNSCEKMVICSWIQGISHFHSLVFGRRHVHLFKRNNKTMAFLDTHINTWVIQYITYVCIEYVICFTFAIKAFWFSFAIKTKVIICFTFWFTINATIIHCMDLKSTILISIYNY